MSDDTDRSVLEDLLVEDPDVFRLADCLEGIIGITRDTHTVVTLDPFEDLPNSAQVVAFCLGQWAAHHLDLSKPTHPRIARVESVAPLQSGDYERLNLLAVTDQSVGVNPEDLEDAIQFVNEAKQYAEKRSASKQTGGAA